MEHSSENSSLSASSEEEEFTDEGTDIDEEVTWIEWFVGLKGNEFFVEVDEDFAGDDFNLTNLDRELDRAMIITMQQHQIEQMRKRGKSDQDAETKMRLDRVMQGIDPETGKRRDRPSFYPQALKIILDYEDPEDTIDDREKPFLEQAAQTLYGLIHAR